MDSFRQLISSRLIVDLILVCNDDFIFHPWPYRCNNKNPFYFVLKCSNTLLFLVNKRGNYFEKIFRMDKCLCKRVNTLFIDTFRMSAISCSLTFRFSKTILCTEQLSNAGDQTVQHYRCPYDSNQANHRNSVDNQEWP